MNNDKYLTVSAINRYLKYKMDSDDHLKCVFIKGEISNFKCHTTGHLYFSLKDEYSKINAVMFNSNAKKLTFNPVDGNKVLIMGRITVYEPSGNYQVYVEEMLEDGLGNLYLEFEKLKEKLSKEGLFDENNKKPIPKIPRKIGVVTAPTGAAVRDIITTIKRRFPICEIILFPSLVQGIDAAPDIVKNIKMADEYDLDVLIVGRGGGSIEDLWAFNEEIVARAIFEAKVPIISAVGHEIDYTIADFVADLRAPTPTAAAELAVPNILDIIKHIEQLKIRLNENLYSRLNYNRLALQHLKNSFIIKNPMILYENKKQKLDITKEILTKNILIKLDMYKQILNNLKNNYFIKNPQNIYIDKIKKLNNLIEKIEILNPIGVLKRGYTLTYKNEKLVKNVNDVSVDDKLTIKFNDGKINVSVYEIMEE